MSVSIRMTVHPGEDVLVPTGVRFDTLLGPLADLLRRPELRHAAWWCDGVPVARGAVTGERPLLAGATLRAGSPPGAAPDDGALHAAWIVARVTGADAGELVGVGPGAPVVLPGGVRVRVARRGVRVYAPWRASRRRAAIAVSGRSRRRRVGLVGRRWRPGDVLDDDGVHYVLHRSGDAAAILAGLAAREPGGAGRRGPGLAGLLATAVLPVAAPIGLAVALRQPLFALFALLGLLAAAPQVAAAIRRRRHDSAGTSAGGDGARPDVAGTTARLAGPVAEVARTGRPGAPPCGPSPALPAPDALARTTLAAVHAAGATWRGALDAHRAADGLLTTAPAGGIPDGAPGGFVPRSGGHTGGTRERLLPDGALAIRGTGPRAEAVARAVVAGLAACGATIRVEGRGVARWAWCRWLDGATGAEPATAVQPSGPSPRVFVTDSPTPAGLDAAHAAHRAGADVVLCLDAHAPTPAWCRGIIDVGPVQTRHTHPDGATTTAPLVGVTEAWAERFARRVAAARSLGRDITAWWAAPPGGPGAAAGAAGLADPNDPRLPTLVPLLDLVAPAPAAGAAGPRPDAPAWAVPLGVGADGRPVTFDLVADGPHLLIAGTTGAGKSELLQALVLTLALQHGPADLSLALIDFKGGASLGPCGDLPHVVGQVSDLDAGLAARALDGLHAELRRRKQILAAHAVADLADLPSGTLPRLVVVVDEFRALADDLPDLVPGLLRVAAQGRSLGVHLVLATQRPAGAVSADVRANVSARLALRVVDPADSYDVVDSPAAAHIAPGIPGRAVLRTGAAPPTALQCAYAGAAPRAADAVGRAPAWPATATPHGAPAGAPTWTATDRAGVPDVPGGPGRPGTPGTPDVPGTPGGADAVAALVARIRSETAPPSPPWPAPWLPALPTTVHTREIDAPTRALPFALGDSPSTQERVPLLWDPAAGHLAVVGRARTGRTTTLRTLAHAALDRGWHVHALVPPSAVSAFDDLSDHPGFGTLAGPHSPHRARRLLRLVGARPECSPPVLVLVDGLEDLRAALSAAADDVLGGALTDGAATFAITAQTAALGALGSRFGPRLVLLSSDGVADGMLGAPSRWAGRGSVPGRGVWLAGTDPLECQVALPPGSGDARAARTVGRHSGPLRPDAPGAAPGPVPARVLSLPRTVTSAALHAVDGRALGVGGDDARPVRLDAPRGALVVGPRGSGRTTALRVVLKALESPRDAVVVARNGPLARAAHAHGARVEPPTAAALRGLLAHWTAPPGTRLAPVLLVDDVDALAQVAPAESDRLAELASDGLVTVIASSTTMAAALAQRGLIAHLRAARTGIVLAPGERGASEVFDTPLDEVAAPGARRPGRAALVVDGQVCAVQLATPTGDPDPVSVDSLRPVSSLAPPAA